MKKISYIMLMIFAFYGGTTAVPMMRNISNAGVYSVLFQFLALISQLIGLLLIYRIYLFIKHRTIVVPNEFSGGIATFCYLCLALPIVTFFGYLIISMAGARNGLSGIPLGMALIISTSLCTFAYFICESRAIASAWLNRNPSKNQ
jgi:hypothetical protein